MTTTDTPVLERYRAALGVLGDVVPTTGELSALTDAELLALNELQTRGGRMWGSAGAVIAGEFAHRSRPELGSDGLARRTGHRTVENLLKSTTGATKEQVLTVVAAGTLLAEMANEGAIDELTGEVLAPSQPWLRAVANALLDSAISTSASHSIAHGLGAPNSAVSTEQLAVATVQLVARAVAGVDADTLWRNARDLRNELDLSGVKIREAEARALRGLTHHPLPAGGGIATWRMDIETYAGFVDFYDRATSPKRGGVRFVDPARAQKARKIEEDDRTFQQIASDALEHFLKAGADADDSVMLGSGAPMIRITVAEHALETGVGFGRVDGQADPVCLDTVRRLMENGTSLRVGFDPGGAYVGGSSAQKSEDPLVENRLYNKRQREILAAKFGGCMDPNCDRPPSWCEAHHIEFVARDGGKSTIENGILLCKFHHLKYHNDGYEIRPDLLGRYWKIPPKTLDPDQTPIPMPLKTRNLEDLWDALERDAS